MSGEDYDGLVESLAALYWQHERGEIGELDGRWTEIQNAISRYCRGVVVRMTRSRDFHGLPLEERIEDVSHAVLCKFVEKKFRAAPAETEKGMRAFSIVMNMASRNELLSAFRRSRSPCTTYYEGAENAWSAHQSGAMLEGVDLFAKIRDRLRPFRFAEASFIREAILAYFLQTRTFPGQRFLHQFGVSTQSSRIAMYNAALFDINSAMIDHVNS